MKSSIYTIPIIEPIQNVIENLNLSSNFFDRFDDNNIGLYSLEELGVLREIDPRFLVFLIGLFEDTNNRNVYSRDLNFSLRDVLNYLYITHNDYRDRRLKIIERLIFNILKSKQAKNSMYSDLLCNTYYCFKKELLTHLAQEEAFLFPCGENLLLGISNNEQQELKNFLLDHHEDTEECIFSFWGLIPSYTLSYNEVESWVELEVELLKFKQDLLVHAWVEEELLIPTILHS